MANGFFLGGVASGADTARARGQRDTALAQQQQQLGLGERRLTEDVRLREQALGLQERQVAGTESRQDQEKALSIANGGINQMTQAIAQLRQQGKTPEEIQRVIAPVFQSLSPTIAMAGLDPAQIQQQLQLAVQSAPPSEAEQFRQNLAASQAPAAAAPAAPAAAPQIAPGTVAPPPANPETDALGVIRPSQRAVNAALALGGATGNIKSAQEIIEEDIKAQVAQRDPNAGRFKDPKQKFDAEQSLRKEFLGASKNFIVQRNNFERLQSTLDTGAGDVALIFTFMKVLDPLSTVREGEFATAEQTAGIPDRVVAQYNKAIEGDRLADPQRKAFKDQATAIFKTSRLEHRKRTKLYEGLARSNGLEAGNVAVNIGGQFRLTDQGDLVRVE